MDEGTKQWDHDKIAQWFEPLTYRDILCIPLNNMHTKDTLTWNENRGRSFSIKTVYKVAMRLQNPSLGDHSLARQDGRVWRSIWALNIPPKVRNFLWIAYANILPTRSNLQRRKVKVDAHYAIC